MIKTDSIFNKWIKENISKNILVKYFNGRDFYYKKITSMNDYSVFFDDYDHEIDVYCDVEDSEYTTLINRVDMFIAEEISFNDINFSEKEKYAISDKFDFFNILNSDSENKEFKYYKLIPVFVEVKENEIDNDYFKYIHCNTTTMEFTVYNPNYTATNRKFYKYFY